jgi:small subunit ribosomal protein S16
VAVKIRLKRMGKIRAPYYRIVVADSRTKRDGRAIEEIGKYHPTHDPSVMEVKRDRVQYWLSVGAQPTEQVLAILKVTGDWQTFKGEPGGEGTLRVAAPKTEDRSGFTAAREAEAATATSGRGARAGRAAKAEKVDKPEAPAVEAPVAEAPAVEAPVAEAPAVEAPAAEAAVETWAPVAEAAPAEA